MISYYDANTESHISYDGVIVWSSAGYTSGPEYDVLYRLSDGRFLSGTRHQDRGDLMTDVRLSRPRR